MARKLTRLLVSAGAALLVPLLFAPPGDAADSDSVVAGTFTITVDVATNAAMPPAFRSRPGKRTYFFGAGCTLGSACDISRVNQDGQTVEQPLTPGAGGFSWSASQVLDCTDTVTGQVSTPGGADFSFTAKLAPTSTVVRDGVTYVTGLRGSTVGVLSVNAKGRADGCDIPPRNTVVERERAVLTGTLVPLGAPPDLTSPTPLAATGSGSSAAAAVSTMSGFELPQTDRQRTSAQAVADGRRSSVPGALVTPTEALGSFGARVPRELLLAALIGLLILFPAQLFNSTYEENHRRIDRQLARLKLWRRRQSETLVPGRARRLGVFAACLLAGTLLGGLLDPGFGPDVATYALLLGIFLSMIVAVNVASFAAREFRTVTHNEHTWYLRAIPSALLIAVVCVAVSRLTDFQPGYLYGVLGGALFAASLDRRTEGRAEVAVAVTVLVVAVVAWVGFEPVARLADGTEPSFAVLATDAFLGSLFIGGIEGLLFGLVPLRFLPGYRIKNWSWAAWGVLTAVTLFTFVHVLLMPESGYLGRSTVASVTLTLTLLGVFATASVLFWFWFRLRPEPPEKTVDLAAVVPAEVPTELVTAAHAHEGDAAPQTRPGARSRVSAEVAQRGDLAIAADPLVLPRQAGPPLAPPADGEPRS